MKELRLSGMYQFMQSVMVKANRIDARIVEKERKRVVVIEMSCCSRPMYVLFRCGIQTFYTAIIIIIIIDDDVDNDDVFKVFCQASMLLHD